MEKAKREANHEININNNSNNSSKESLTNTEDDLERKFFIEEDDLEKNLFIEHHKLQDRYDQEKSDSFNTPIMVALAGMDSLSLTNSSDSISNTSEKNKNINKH